MTYQYLLQYPKVVILNGKLLTIKSQRNTIWKGIIDVILFAQLVADMCKVGFKHAQFLNNSKLVDITQNLTTQLQALPIFQQLVLNMRWKKFTLPSSMRFTCEKSA